MEVNVMSSYVTKTSLRVCLHGTGVTVYNTSGCDGISHLFQSSLPSPVSLSFTPAANQHLKGSFDTEKESEGGTGRWG